MRLLQVYFVVLVKLAVTEYIMKLVHNNHDLNKRRKEAPYPNT